ncbi:MAG: hypothetical protein Q9165_002580 [Trypethelium subeluteriae]
MLPPFGFSVGDFITAFNLINKVRKAVRESGGASTEYVLLMQELQSLQLVLEHLQSLPASSEPSLSHINAVRGMARTIEVPLQAFLDKIDRFRDTLGDGSRSCLKRVMHQAQWATGMQEEVGGLRAAITMKIVSISMLMSISAMDARPLKNQQLDDSKQLLQLIRSKADENTRNLSNQLDKVTAKVQSTSELARLDTRRLLQVCAGLQVGVERIERRQWLQQRKSQDSQPRRISRIEHQTSSLQRNARSLNWSLCQATRTAGQLIERFGNLSKDILEYLKNI